MFSRTVPALSSVLPVSESTTPAVGTGPMSARNDHVHTRLSSSTRVTLDASSTATVMYTRTFTSPPVFSFAPLNASGQPVLIEHTSDIMGTGAQAGLYVGCTIRGSRSQLLPILSGIVLIGPLITALSAFNVLGGSASGVAVSVFAIQPSA